LAGEKKAFNLGYFKMTSQVLSLLGYRLLSLATICLGASYDHDYFDFY
jgi:hypothetical protein